MTIRTRFAPSPTGYLHIGGARTALYSWLYARRHGGTFVLRIEDTDLERSTAESVNAILEGMTWLGLEYDEGPFYQTRRFDRYKEVIQQLLDEDKAYHCYCSKEEVEAMREEQRAKKLKPRYDGRCRHRKGPPPEGIEPVIRFKNPVDGVVLIDDMVKGKVAIQNSELDDLVIARQDGTPTYNLTVVVDDWDMNITHVIRGDDHLNNTPRQINILEALGAPVPRYAHVAMILGPDGQRLSKRHGAVSVMQYREKGLLPEALLNYLVRLGWSHGDQEIFSIDEMTQLFDVERVNKAASSFNEDKLLWVNQQYIKSSDPEHLAHHLGWYLGEKGIDPASGPELQEVVKTQMDRAKTLVEMADNCAFFYVAPESYDEKDAAKHLKPEVLPAMNAIRDSVARLEDWYPEAIHEVVKFTAEHFQLKMGQVAQPVRVAMVGKALSPSIDVTLYLLGRDQVLSRLDRMLEWLELHQEGR
ncbi:MAG: glutamate--tRNA ligase [Gammaproteobacteria bacterium]|nr:glutamate--tRNA ligase [Gammaproteobacteria bacterium]